MHTYIYRYIYIYKSELPVILKSQSRILKIQQVFTLLLRIWSLILRILSFNLRFSNCSNAIEYWPYSIPAPYTITTGVAKFYV